MEDDMIELRELLNKSKLNKFELDMLLNDPLI